MKLLIDKKKIKLSILDLLNNGLACKNCTVKTDVSLHAPFERTINADVVVFDQNNRPVAVFEIEGFAQGWAMQLQMLRSLPRTMKVLEISHYIVTDGDDYFLMSSGDRSFLQVSFDKILSTINKNSPALGTKPSLEEIGIKLNEIADRVNLKQKNDILRYLSGKRIRPLFKMDSATGYIEFATLKKEDAFFSHLLKGRIPTRLCRFTTRHNLFLLLRDGKQNMCSIVCMNDKSEESYADTKVGFDIRDDVISVDNNSCFILSLLPEQKSDDLTMWRLYGDDARGVCLNYRLNDKQRGRKLKGDFYISCVSYGIDSRSHPELDFIKKMVSEDFNNWHFHLNRWYIWKHFFKSFRFKDEKEIRLLYISDNRTLVEKQWIENEQSGIVSKMLLFKMIPENKFPLCLDGVIVGPKAPEPSKILEQFNYLVEQEWGHQAIGFSLSRIKEYR